MCPPDMQPVEGGEKRWEMMWSSEGMRPGVLGRSAGHPTLIAKSVTPKEAGGRKAVRRSAGVEGRSGAGGVSRAS